MRSAQRLLLLVVVAWTPSAAGAQESAEYAIGRPRLPCVGSACGFLQVVDASLRTRSPGGRERGGLRLLLAERVYLGGEWSRGRRSVVMRSARVEGSYERRPGRGDAIRLEARAPRLRLRVDADRTPRRVGHGWDLDGEVGLRLGTDLEIGVGYTADLDLERVDIEPHVTRGARLVARWQPEWRHEVEARLQRDTLRTPVGRDLDRTAATLAWEGLLEPVRLRVGLGYERLGGTLGRSELAVDVAARARVASRLTVDAGWNEAVETGLASIGRGVRAGVALHARRFRFARGGEVARSVERLVRAAHARGINEMRVYGTPGLRALRERVGLAGVDELSEMAEALYGAQIADRNVELLGVAVGWSKDLDLGTRRRRVELRLGVPWPLMAPWERDENAVELLTVALEYEELDVSAGLREVGRSVAMMLRLHRELALHATWAQPVRTALQLALGSEPSTRTSFGLAYAFGR